MALEKSIWELNNFIMDPDVYTLRPSGDQKIKMQKIKMAARLFNKKARESLPNHGPGADLLPV